VSPEGTLRRRPSPLSVSRLPGRQSRRCPMVPARGFCDGVTEIPARGKSRIGRDCGWRGVCAVVKPSGLLARSTLSAAVLLATHPTTRQIETTRRNCNLHWLLRQGEVSGRLPDSHPTHIWQVPRSWPVSGLSGHCRVAYPTQAK
jgi:hypothetical protein